MPDLTITSPTNPRIKELVALRRRRAREDSASTVLEGLEETTLALDAGVLPFAVYVCPELMSDETKGEELASRCRDRGVEVVQLSRAACERAAYREGPDGVLARVPTPGTGLADLPALAGSPPFVLLCEGVEKPGNLGAMLRTADAVGVDLVLAVDPVTDWGNPNVIRSSKGTVFSVPVATAGREEASAWLAQQGIRLVATTPDTSMLHTEADLTGPLAIAVGTEKYGLTQASLRGADERVRIPMHGQVNSLNVATSAAVVLYEAVRQRGSQR